MAQMLARGATPTAPTGVITVADLLSRYAPAPVVDPEPVTVPVSMGSLLRREGRAPHTLDRPLQPRASQARVEQDVDDEYDTEPESPRSTGMLVRRGAIAAGVLVAAGSVFGAAVVDDASSRATTDARGDYPGQGRLDSASMPDAAIPTVVDPAALAALSEVLDPGAAPSTSWMAVAGGGSAGTGTGAPSGGDGSTQAQSGPSAGSTDPGGSGQGGGAAGGADAGGDNAGGGAPTGSGGAGQGGGNGSSGGSGNPDPSTSDDAPAPSGGGLGGAVQEVGDNVPGPVGGAVEGLGDGVSDLGDGVQSATGGDDEDPGVVGSVGRLAGSLL